MKIAMLALVVCALGWSQPTISGANAFWWLGSGITADGYGCATETYPCYYAQAAWTANANGASGTPTWHINTVSGGGNASLSCTTCTNTVATSTAPSNGCVADISVYVTYPDGSESDPSNFKVVIGTPTTFTYQSVTDSISTEGSAGYTSATAWNLTDSCGYSDPGLDVNEVFGTFVDDYSGENWPEPFPGATNEPTYTVTDYQTASYPTCPYPPAEDPGSPPSGPAVRHNPWSAYVGTTTHGSGVFILADTQQNYQDHARHQ